MEMYKFDFRAHELYVIMIDSKIDMSIINFYYFKNVNLIRKEAAYGKG
jgi:hypothetical protein